jgi:hypothetical protein
MSAAEYLRSTPPEIVLKVEALTDEKRYQASRDYQFIVALLNGYHEPQKFPSFDRFYPEKTQKTPEPRREMTDEEARRDLLRLTP